MARPVHPAPELGTARCSMEGGLALGGVGSSALGSAVRTEASGEDAQQASVTGMRFWASSNQLSWAHGHHSFPALIKGLLGSLLSHSDARGGTGWGLLCISCGHLTHSKLLFMNSGRMQSKGSHCLMMSDIRKVQSSFHAGRVRAARHGEPAALGGCCILALAWG